MALRGFISKSPNEYYEEGVRSSMRFVADNTPDDVIEIELSPFSGFYAGFGEYTKKLYFRKKNLPWYISLLKEENSNT